MTKSSTATSTFGVGDRRNHNSALYYARHLGEPVVITDPVVADCPEYLRDTLIPWSSEDMSMIPDNCVALVVTSPNYHVGKVSDFDDMAFDSYLQMLETVFAECYRVLEPGGRIAVNIANLGRKPYIYFTDKVVEMCQNLGFNGRGEIIWVKGKGASGSIAVGTYMKAKNPVVRDLHEYIELFCKGPFGRVREGESTITKEEFFANTLSVWEMRPASAKRVGHPAPFPIDLPRRLIESYTFKGDVVLDPFVGAGTTAVAAVRTGRSYIGFDIDSDYLVRAQERIDAHRTWVDGNRQGTEPA